ncbi:hypothetical protein Tco_1522936 [Tanacetum coccineum]
MAGPGPITPLNEGTSNQNTTKSIIKGHVSALKELLKEPNNRDLIKPMLLDFDDIQDVSDEEIKVGTKGKAEGGNKDLSKLFKEVLKCPFTRRIVKFSSPGPGPITPLNEGTSNQNTIKSIIKGHASVLKELLKEPSNRDLIKPMLLDFDDIQDVSNEEIEVGTKGKAEGGNEDLSKPFKEVLKCPFTRRIVEFSSPGHIITANAKIYDQTGDLEDHVGRFMGMRNQGEWPMPVWCRMFQQTLDGKARAWFYKLPPGSIDN